MYSGLVVLVEEQVVYLAIFERVVVDGVAGVRSLSAVNPSVRVSLCKCCLPLGMLSITALVACY
jgi:hypothetical protein